MAHETFSRPEQPQGSSNRSFGLVFSGFFFILAALNGFGKLPFKIEQPSLADCPLWLDHPELRGNILTAAFSMVGVIFLVMALTFPQALTPMNRLWTRFGLLLHMVVSPLVLGVLFFLVFTPMGIMLRLFGGDPLKVRFDSKAQSYWIKRSTPGPSPASLKNQF